MSFINPNIYFTADGFWMRWTLVGFIIINVLLGIYLFRKKSITLTCEVNASCMAGNGILLPTLIYISTIPIYSFKDVIGNGGESALYKVAEYLNSIESLVVIILLVTLIYGFTYKNSYTFINLYFRVVAVIEITYIISCYITSQVKLDRWYNWFGVILLGVAFVVLSKIKIESVKANTPQLNFHNAINAYNSLFSTRKYQANEIVNIIESDISESGYSICVTGEWGAGKTSLVNGAYNKAKQNGRFKLYKIRINALELDDSVSLINYFFKQIEDIIKTNGIYTGIASEYKELIASISGTIVSESATNFILRKSSGGNSDYRENIKKLSRLLFDNLCGSRIIIIIDDIERCSLEKAKSYLFLMKEIATMNRCITVFLADIDELKKTCNLDESFFEKFFNHTISLTSVGFDEILFSLMTVSVEISGLNDEILKILKKFDIDIEKTEKEMFLYINTPQERQDYKAKRINSIKDDKEQFIIELSNPRRVIKIAEYYKELIQQVNKQLNSSGEKQAVVRLFLEKVDYKKQLSLLSIIYGLYSSEFILMQRNGIYNYIGDLESRFKTERLPEEKIYRVESLIDDEWCFFHRHSSNYRIQEVLRFINCLLTDIDELANISNGYTSLEEQYISIIKSGKLPKNVPFPDLVEMIYTATYDKLSERKKLIKIIFDLYEKGFETDLVDASFELFSHNVARNFFSCETPILQMFENVFCTNSYRLANSERIKRSFTSFADGYLWRNATTFSRYFLPVSSPERVSYENWNNASEAVLSQNTCEDMLNAYCKKCESYLDFSNEVANANAISRLQNLIIKVNAEYSELEMTECSDVLETRKCVDELITEITFLFEIESFINKCKIIAEESSFNIRALSADTLSLEIDKLYNELFEEIDYDRNKDIQGLLQFVCGSERGITLDEYEKLNRIVEKFCIEHNPVASWRQMLIYLKKNIAHHQNVIDSE